MPRRLFCLLLLVLAACTSAAQGSADSRKTVTNAVRAAKAHVARSNDVIIIIRDPAAAGSSTPKVAYSGPTGSGMPKELVVDSIEDIKRLEKRGKQHLQQPKDEEDYKQPASYPPHQEGDEGAESEPDKYISSKTDKKRYAAEEDRDEERSSDNEKYQSKSGHADDDDSKADDRKYEDGEYSSRSKESSEEREYEHSNKDDSSSEHKQYKEDDSSSYHQEEESTEKPTGSSYSGDKRRSEEEGRESYSSGSEEPESSEQSRRSSTSRSHKESKNSDSGSKRYKQQDEDDYQPAPRKDPEYEDRPKKQQEDDSDSDRKYKYHNSDKYSDKYQEREQEKESDTYRPEENKYERPNRSERKEDSDSGDKGSNDGSGVYPKLEEGGSYYTKPELHTTCLQVMRAAGDASGLATYDLRCCTASDDPKICDESADKQESEAGPYSIINRMPAPAPTPKGMMEVLKATTNLKVATCAFMPSEVPCPFYTAGACQVFNGTCMLSKAAAECGCPGTASGTGMLLEVAAYAEPVAGLSCNPVFTVARTGNGVVPVDDGAPYLGVANVMHGTGQALEDDDISARMTFISGFGVPEKPMGPGVLTDGLPAMPFAAKPAYNGRKAYGQRQLPMAFGPAPSSPMPHPDLPFFLGGRMILQWSSSTGK